VVCLFNGDGREYAARVTAAGRKSVELDVTAIESPTRELTFPLAVAAPLPKGDRGQFLVEKLTELGVTTFVPLRTARSVVHPGEGKLEKLERYVIEASKQCGRNVLMQVEATADWAALCHRTDLPPARFVAHPGPGDDKASFPADNFQAGVLAAVGPEGGFTDEEVGTATAAGWRRVSLGPRVLRVETAAVALAVLASGGR
jgi:16S rRNA (uracil1498-N3)-methyltransferase